MIQTTWIDQLDMFLQKDRKEMMLWNNDSRSEDLKADYWLLKQGNDNNYGKNYMIEDGNDDYDGEVIENYAVVLSKMDYRETKRLLLTLEKLIDCCLSLFIIKKINCKLDLSLFIIYN